MAKKKPQSRRTTRKPTAQRQLLGEGIQIIAITFVAMFLYIILFPFISANVFGLIGTGQSFLLFPQISNSLDFFGLLAIVFFFLVHLFATRVIVQKNYVIWSSFLSFGISFGIYIVLGNIVLLFYVFIYIPDIISIGGGTVNTNNPAFLSQINDAIIPESPDVPSLTFVNMLIFILMYSIFFLVLTRFLRGGRRKSEK